MIPYEVDPSLHPAEPVPLRFDDGFAPPPRSSDGPPAGQPVMAPEAALEDKSLF